MSWNIGNAILQPGDTKNYDQGGNKATFVFKDSLDNVNAKASALKEGDVIFAGWKASTWSVRSIPGGWGELSIDCVPPNPTHEEGEGPEKEEVTDPLEDIWSIKSCRNDVSLMAYCGESVGANPLRDQIEGWLKETDTDLVQSFKYKDENGREIELTDPTQELAKKFAKGVQSVMRFYPVITRKRIYASVPPACLEKVGFIDTPSYSGAVSPTTKKKIPNGLSAAIEAHQWLKCQDDADEQSDGNWVRTEAWMGIPKSDDPNDSPWDPDLYGDSRWAMPYEAM